jgi:hypothetical protein
MLENLIKLDLNFEIDDKKGKDNLNEEKNLLK